MNNINTSINICDVNFKNPVIAASGTFGFGMEYNELYDIGVLGGICTKGLTINSKEGNRGIRLWETRGGLINSIGLENPGINFFIKHYIREMRKFDTNIIVNLGGNDIEEYVKGAEILSVNDIDMIELNISCPNVKHGGMAFGIKSKTAYEVVQQVKKVCKKPLIVKLSPNAENIVEMAIQCEKAGADAISLVNTFKSMAVDVRKRKAVFNNITAGLSGACIKPIALRMVYEVCKNVSIPVIGIGGIEKGEDAIEFIMAGAKAVEVGTANFVNPLACKNIIKEIEEFMINENIKNIEDIRGII